MAHNVSHELILTSQLDFSVVDERSNGLDFFFGHSICEENYKSRFKNIGLTIAKNSLGFSEHSEMTDSIDGILDGGGGVGPHGWHNRFKLIQWVGT